MKMFIKIQRIDLTYFYNAGEIIITLLDNLLYIIPMWYLLVSIAKLDIYFRLLHSV